MEKEKKRNQIIVALDTDISAGMNLVDLIEEDEELKSMIYGYKVGSLWILEAGLDAIEDLGTSIEDDHTIILDMQKWPTDIPQIVKKQVDKLADIEYVDELIGCPMGGGINSFESFIKACQDGYIRPLVVLEMTHPGSDSWLIQGYHMQILNCALDNGIDGLIIPATKTPRPEIKEVIDTKYPDLGVEFYTTGYKVQGGQARPMLDFGVSKFIIGSYIYEAPIIKEAIISAYYDING